MKNLLYFQKFKTILFLFVLSVLFQSCKKEEIKPKEKIDLIKYSKIQGHGIKVGGPE